MAFDDARETWNKRFSRDDYIFGFAPNEFLASKKDLLRPGQVALCVADGEGRNSVWLAEQGLIVRAFDISPVGVEKAKKLARERGISAESIDFEVADVHGFAWPSAAFDVAAVIFVQFADPDMRTFMFERIATALKPGGLLLLQGYTPKQLEYKTGGPPIAENLYTEAMLREAFAAFEIIELSEHDSVIEEGTQHAGMSALIDMVARKA